jgi:hypothetical protein
VGSYENHVAVVIPAKFGNRKFLPQIEQFKSHFRFFLLLWKLLTGSELFGPKEFLVPKYWGGEINELKSYITTDPISFKLPCLIK